MDKEIEVRFLEVNKDEVVKKLKELGAENFGEKMLEEIIFYDHDLKWLDEHKRIRLRKTGSKVMLSYKQNKEQTVDSAVEAEVEVSDMEEAAAILRGAGLVEYRHQQKKRHTLKLDGVIADIDTWPNIPTYVELEGPSEAALKDVAQKLGFKWSDAVFANPRTVLKERYHIPLDDLHWFTFDRME